MTSSSRGLLPHDPTVRAGPAGPDRSMPIDVVSPTPARPVIVTEPPAIDRVELILRQVDALPTLSPIATRLLELGSDASSDIRQIVRLIESDPALTARILALCRRSHLGLGDRITTVHRAVVMLGLDAVRAAVLSVSVYELLRPTESEPAWTSSLDVPFSDAARAASAATMDRFGLWKHAVAVACAAELIAARHRRERIPPEEAFVAGLLHDLGKLVLDLMLPRTYARVVAIAEQRRSPASAVERSLIGLDHHTAGKRLAERWGLSPALGDVMWLHGQPARALPDVPHRKLIGLVTVAKALCRCLHIGWSGEFDPPPRVADLCCEYDLDPAQVDAIVPQLHEAVADRCRALGLEDRPAPEVLLQSVVNANRQLGRLSELLERRARDARRQSETLRAIVAFHADAHTAADPIATLAAIARSAAGLLGPGFYALLAQCDAPLVAPPPETTDRPRHADPSDPAATRWLLGVLDPGSQQLHLHTIEPPPPGLDLLLALGQAPQLNVSAMAVLPWLGDALCARVDLRRTWIVPLVGDEPLRTDAESTGQLRAAPCPALLLHDRMVDPGAWRIGALAAMRSCWAAAFAHATQRYAQRRLSEALAEANRSLAEAQGELAEARAMARLGQVTAGAAHEMNNPLTVIRGRAQQLRDRLTDERDRQAAGAIERAAADLAQMVSSLHLLARAPSPRRALVDLASLIADAIRRAEHRTGVTGRIRLAHGPALPAARVDREMLTDALIELLANALEADPDADVLVRVQTDIANGRLVLQVQDSGPGLSHTAMHHAFDPFFSDKPAGRRPGLGLTRARRLVEAHAGRISLTNAPHRGALCTIDLPLENDPTSQLHPD